ncbi:hypothetical protein [Flammeovirga sp. SubArs3]|uniref:hypothetical protein n=1 Tax=Flammeovirga sp. SubArs3 TaxID=2995316 RepID=UPI00248C7BB7|nr:hypothetical protein [Flammeovirga sp. SubArs3]
MKKLLFSVCVIITVSALGYVGNLRWFQCKYCAIIVRKSSYPVRTECPNKEGERHYWKNLGEVGEIYYKCDSCGTVLQTKSKPLSGICIKQDGNYHKWKREYRDFN